MYALKRYYDVPAVRDPIFPPTGRSLYFISDASGVPQLWTVSLSGGAAHQATFFHERVQQAECSPVDGRVIFGMDTGGDEHQQLYLFEDRNAIPLTNDPETIHNFGAWSPDARSIAYSCNRRDRAYFDVYLRDMATGKERHVFQHDSMNHVWGWSPDGRHLLISRTISLLANELFILDVKTADLTQLTPGRGDTAYEQARWSRESRSLYVLTNQDRPFYGLATLDIASRELEYLPTPDWDVEALTCSPDTGALAFAINEGGASCVRVLREGNGSPQPVEGLPRGVVNTLRWSPGGRWLGVGVNCEVRGGEVWLADPVRGTAKRLSPGGGAALPPGGRSRPCFISPRTRPDDRCPR